VRERDEVFVALPLRDGTAYYVTASLVSEMQVLYPSLDVEQEFLGMRSWCILSESQRKTRSGIKRFIHAWLARTQNNGFAPGRAGPGPPHGSLSAAVLATEDAKAENAVRVDSDSGTRRKGRKQLYDEGVLEAAGFYEFWELYPIKVGKDDARAAWLDAFPEANPDLLAVILDSVGRYICTDTWQEHIRSGKGYIPHPATYISKRRWNDVIPVPLQGVYAGGRHPPGFSDPYDLAYAELEEEERRATSRVSQGGLSTSQDDQAGLSELLEGR